MSLLWASLVVVAFAAVLEALDLPERAREAGRRAGESLDVLRDPELDDRAKERRLQGHALRLFVLLGLLVGGSALAIGLPLGGVWLLERAGAASLASVLGVLERPDFLVGATVVGLAAYLGIRRLRGA